MTDALTRAAATRWHHGAPVAAVALRAAGGARSPPAALHVRWPRELPGPRPPAISVRGSVLAVWDPGRVCRSPRIGGASARPVHPPHRRNHPAGAASPRRARTRRRERHSCTATTHVINQLRARGSSGSRHRISLNMSVIDVDVDRLSPKWPRAGRSLLFRRKHGRCGQSAVHKI